MHRYASQTPEARELVAELEFVWDQIKANTSSGSESAMSSPVRTLGVPPLSPQQQQQQQQRPPPPAWRNQSQNHHQQRTYASIGGRLAQQQQPAAYEDMVAIVNANERPGRGETSSRLRVLSPVSQPDDMYQRRSSGLRNYDDEDEDGDDGDERGRNMDEKEEDDDEEEEYEEAQDTLYDNDDDDEDNDHNIHHDDDNNTQHTTSEDREDYTEEASSIQQHHGKNTPPMTPPPSNRKPSSSAAAAAKHQPPPNARRWRRRVEQALTKMTAEIAAVREQMEVRAIQHRRRSSAWAWIKWLAWVALRQVFWDLAVLAMLLIWMRIKGDRRVEEKLKAGWSELKGKLGRLRFLRSMPRVGMLP